MNVLEHLLHDAETSPEAREQLDDFYRRSAGPAEMALWRCQCGARWLYRVGGPGYIEGMGAGCCEYCHRAGVGRRES